NTSKSDWNKSAHFCFNQTNNSCLCGSTRSRQRYSRSLAATAKSVSSSSSIALSTNHCRCRRNSLPGSSKQFTTSNCSTFSQLTASRASGRRCCQNSSSPSCCHSSHPSQQAPKVRGRRNSRPLSFTWTLSTTSAGTSRS